MVTALAQKLTRDSSPGMQKTELGLIPNEWRVVHLASKAKLESGHTPSRRKPEYWGGEIPWVSLHDSDALDGLEILVTAQSVTEAGIANSSARLLPKGTVVFSRTATVGKATVLGRAMATSQDFACYICGPEVHNYFLAYLFRHMAPQWKKLMAGSTHNTVYMPVFRDLYVVLPPLSEQQAIAEALADADALIDVLENLINKKRAIMRGAMQELLSGRTRLPGFDGSWESQPLGELCEVVNGLTYAPSNVREAGTLVLRSSNIQAGVLSFQDNVFVQMDVPEKALVKKDDILICVRNGSRELIGKCAKIDARCEGMAFGAFMAVLRTPLHDFMLYQFRSEAMKQQITAHLGATINQITNKSLKEFIVRVPPSANEAAAISEVLADMDEELSVLNERLVKARQIKQGMMQELLIGRVRLA